MNRKGLARRSREGTILGNQRGQADSSGTTDTAELRFSEYTTMVVRWEGEITGI